MHIDRSRLASTFAGAHGRAVRFDARGRAATQPGLAADLRDAQASVARLIELVCELTLTMSRAQVVTSLFALAHARGLVDAEQWPDYLLAYEEDPEGARRALTFD